ncbi:DUF397 domain-containing protein [Actinoallomurus soli]|uniref:DUF397 domain-containing protein n=1 Tax=Actinoallomurus soli TaxID=2952535 RepID=UPI00209322A7|nr:DUF397 domain-containing protein [Actinoallomurus soli]MCO5968308.1 DUF397 domain-containing protein [Actinoallomurus soli]
MCDEPTTTGPDGAGDPGSNTANARGAGEVRRSRDRSGPRLLIAAAAWEAFLALVRKGINELLK